MAKVIYDSQISDFLSDLSGTMTVIAPVEKGHNHGGQYQFQKWTPTSKIVLKYPVTLLPPKEFLIPARDVLFSFADGTVTPTENEAQVLFGLSREDLEGLDRLDKIMSEPVTDEPYLAKRAKTFLIGLDKYSAPDHLNFDLYFQEFEAGVFAVTAKTKQGKKWLSSKHFKNHSVRLPTVIHKVDPLLADPDLARSIKESPQHPVWKELSDICFGCGICSYVCPLCYCFETEDSIDFDNQNCGERCRNWDSCMLSGFAATTHHNFRPQLPDRIYNWYYHKFYRLPKEQGISGCVNCSRCVVYCPAKINFRRVLTRVLDDYKKRPAK
jgi:sulfhydrogenase subunit beta (sulfur reductase)